MKPDAKKAKDKARLDRKKEAGRAARAARKEARAVEQDPLRAPETAALVDAVRHQRGERRRRAFLELAALDRGVAVSLVMELLPDAAGQNLEDLGRLLVLRGEARHVDLVIAGRAGEVVVAEVADGDVVVDAAARLRRDLARLDPIEVGHRLRRLGVAPLVDGARDAVGARGGIAALLAEALHHPHRAQLAPAVRDAIVEALLRVAPETLWTRCRDVLEESHGGDPRLLVAALAAGAPLDDTDLLIGWLKGRPADERSRRLVEAGLPESARRLGPEAAAGLWRLCVLDEGLSRDRRRAAALALWTHRGADAADTLLLFPDLAIEVTVELARVLTFDEVWDAIAPTFATSMALRDALLPLPLARRPEILDVMRALVGSDPVGFAAFAVRSEAPHAVDELLQAIERVEDDDDAGWLLLGTLSTSPPSTLRAGRLAPQLSSMVSRTEGGPDVVAGLQALRRYLPRAGAHAVDVDAAIERIVRRFTLAR